MKSQKKTAQKKAIRGSGRPPAKGKKRTSLALYYATAGLLALTGIAVLMFFTLGEETSVQKRDTLTSVENGRPISDVREDTEGSPPAPDGDEESSSAAESASQQVSEEDKKPMTEKTEDKPPHQPLAEEGSGDKTVKKPSKGRIAVVIDDCGYNTHELEPFLSFPGPITFAVLPGLPYTEKAAAMIRKAGKGLILHQPMEALGGENPGPQAVYASMSDLEITATISHNFEELPQARGMNNHMGSKVTSDERAMLSVMNFLKRRGYFFLDSLTTADSEARKAAELTGTPYVDRSVFLDNVKDRQAIVDSVQKGLTAASKQGHAVMIGHVWTDTLADILIEMYPEVLGEEYEFVSLTDLIEGWKE